MIVVLEQTKTLFENIWRIRVFMEKGQTQRQHFWSNFDPLFPMKMAKIEINKQ